MLKRSGTPPYSIPHTNSNIYTYFYRHPYREREREILTKDHINVAISKAFCTYKNNNNEDFKIKGTNNSFGQPDIIYYYKISPEMI